MSSTGRQSIIVAPRLVSIIRRHARQKRGAALTEDELYKSDQRRPMVSEDVAVQAQHLCNICLDLQSHPVLYACGHNNYYTCIRVALEYSSYCPTCRAPILLTPLRDGAQEEAIQAVYPSVVDRTVVDYSFRGIFFADCFAERGVS
ncbi:hypothetical protein DFH06DRAFT_1152576 [Mycena polygramma]|nr:hypothetical protein DFH06DRAFT_1152576 [Mycena polygramma]